MCCIVQLISKTHILSILRIYYIVITVKYLHCGCSKLDFVATITIVCPNDLVAPPIRPFAEYVGANLDKRGTKAVKPVHSASLLLRESNLYLYLY